MSSIENTLVTRVSEFVVDHERGVRDAAAWLSSQVDQHISSFHAITNKALTDLGQLATQFDAHGRALAEAVALIDRSNRHADATFGERRAGIETLVATLDTRTDDIERRLKRFSSLLDESLDGAAGRAREIARIVAEFQRRGRARAGAGTRARQRAAARHLHPAQRRDARHVLADHAALLRDAAGHAADGRRDAARARDDPRRTAPRHPRTAAGDRRQRLADAPRHRRSDRGAGRAQPHRRPPWPRPRRRRAAAPRAGAGLRRRRRPQPRAWSRRGRWGRGGMPPPRADITGAAPMPPPRRAEAPSLTPGSGRQRQQRLALRAAQPRLRSRRPTGGPRRRTPGAPHAGIARTRSPSTSRG